MALPTFICGESDLRSIFQFHGVCLCLPECTDEEHDDTCLVGLEIRMRPVLDFLEKERPDLCAPMRVPLEPE